MSVRHRLLLLLATALLLAGCGGGADAPRAAVQDTSAPAVRSAPLATRSLAGGAQPLPALYRGATGQWYYLDQLGPDGPLADRQFTYGGDPTDLPVAGDWDDDGTLDVGIYRRGTGRWYLVTGWNGGRPAADQQFVYGGHPSDLPLAGDFDGDGTDDPALFRRTTSTWYLLTQQAADGSTVADLQVRFGGRAEDLPVTGDFDGDGRTDLGVFTPSLGLWNLDTNRDGRADATFHYGGPGDRPLAGDFDGDGRDDPALFRPSTGGWFLLTDWNAGGPLADEKFLYGGDPTDVPVVGDFNGDGRSDPGVYRRSAAVFYLLVERVGGRPSADWRFAYGGHPSDLPLTSSALLANFAPYPGDLPDEMLQGLEISPAAVETAAGLQVELVATGRYLDGAARDVTSRASWSSSAPAIASVLAGTVRGESAGSATVTAALGGFQAQVPVTVAAPQLLELRVAPQGPSAAAGTAVALTATGDYSDGVSRDVTAEASWTSAAPSVADFEAPGLARALGPGSATLRAALGGRSAETTLSVTAAVPVSVAVYPPTATLPSGTAQDFTATARFSDGSVQDVTGLATWALQDPSLGSHALVDGRLRLTAQGSGATPLQATFGDVSGNSAVQVVATALTGVSVSPTDPRMARGLQQPLTATGLFADGSTHDLTAQAVWSTSAPAAVAVSNADADRGVATALALGEARVTAAFQGFEGGTMVVVTGASLTGIVVSGEASLPKGVTSGFLATGVYSDGVARDLTRAAAWSSTSTAVATIDLPADNPGGIVRAREPGVTQIRASFGGVLGSAPLEVTPARLTGLSFSGPGETLSTGSTPTRRLVLYANYTGGAAVQVQESAVWSSSNEAVATVSNAAGSRGLVTALSQGTTTVRAEYQGLSAELPVTVNDDRLVAVEIVPSSVEAPLGTTHVLTLRGRQGNGSLRTVTGTWASSAPEIAEIANPSSGSVKALREGQATVTATSGGFQATATIQVTAATLDALVGGPGEVRLPVGFRQQLEGYALYTDGQAVDVTTQVAWTSDDESIARVEAAGDRLGELSALAPGTTTIRGAWNGRELTLKVVVRAATTVRTLTVDGPPTATLPAGMSLRLRATATYEDGATQDVTEQVGWTTDDGAVAAVSNERGSRGRLTTGAPGGTSVRATLGGAQAALPVTVTSAALQSLAISPSTLRLPARLDRQLTATGFFSDGTAVDVTESAAWSSDAPGIYQFRTEAGRVTSVAPGSTVVRAAFGGLEDTSTAVVTDARLLELVGSSGSVPAGGSLSCWVTARFSDGTALTVTESAFWRPSGGVAVSNRRGTRGLATVHAAGGVAAWYGGRVVGCGTTLLAARLLRMEILPGAGPPPFRLNRVTAMSAMGYYTDGVPRPVPVAWSVDHPSLLWVGSGSAYGKFWGTAPGDTVLRAKDAASGVEAALPVTISSSPVIRVEPFVSVSSVPSGHTSVLTANIVFEDGLVIPESVGWTSSNTAVATIESFNNSTLARGRSPGTVTLTARDGWSGVTATIPLTVTAAELLRLRPTLTPAEVPLGFTRQVVLNADFTDGTRDIAAQAEWSSSHPDRVSVSNEPGTKGQVTGVGLGDATVTAVDPATGQTGTLVISGVDARPLSMSIAPTSVTVVPGMPQPVTATATFSNGAVVDVTRSASWSRSSLAFTIVDGSVIGSYAGTGTLTARLSSSWWNVGASCSVTVLDDRQLGTATIGEFGGMEASADGSQLYVAAGGHLRIFDVASRAELAAVALGIYPYGLDVSPDGTHVLVGENYSGNKVSLVRLSDRSVRQFTLPGLATGPRAVAFLSNSVGVAATSQGSLYLIDLGSMTQLSSTYLTGAFERAAVDRVRGRLYLGVVSTISTVGRYDATASPPVLEALRRDGSFRELSPDGSTLVAANSLLSAPDLTTLGTWMAPQTVNYLASWDPSAPRLVGLSRSATSATFDGWVYEVSRADFTTRTVMKLQVVGSAEKVQWPLVSPDGSHLFAASDAGRLYFVRLR